MKRILIVLALMLMLTVCFVGEAFALNYPYGDIRNDNPDGDNHPWGGDEIGIQPPPVSSKFITTSFTTGILSVDLFFRFIILENVEIIESSATEKQSSSYRNYDYRKYSTVKYEGSRK